MVDTSTVLEHFAQVLRRGQLETVTFQEGSAFVAAPREQILHGALTAEDAKTLFDKHDDATRRPDGSTRQDSAIAVVISLATLPSERGDAQDGLLLLSAVLHRDGRLEPDLETATSPWIPSERLTSPAVTDREVMVASLRDFWTHARTEAASAISQTESIEDAVRLAETLFRKASGSSLENFAASCEEEGWQVTLDTCYVQELDRFNAVGGLLQLYDFYARTASGTGLLDRTVGGWRGDRAPETSMHDGTGLLTGATAACGSMSDGFPLTPSQRRAVHAVLRDGEDLTAVSGPPGTGKTTMLQSIVANMLTRRAIAREDAPIIVGTSTNNQAVTNIISSFSAVTKDDPGTLDLRWLPQESEGSASDEALRSLAVYCPAQYKLAEAKKQFLVEQRDRSELYTDYSGEDYLAAARIHFLRRVQTFFGSIAEPADVQDWLHDALTEVDGYRVSLLETMAAHGPSDPYLRLCDDVEASEHLRDLDGLSALRAASTLEALDGALDTTLRYAEFWLAVHYYEAQWLLTDDFVPEDERFKTTRDVVDRYWPQAASLTPCFVMTVYQVPKYFGRYVKPGEPARFDTGRIDLLIVDEAGQVDTALGLPILGLASRAVVVGDEKQLAPVWSLDEETDREMAEGAGVPAETWRAGLRERGLTCSAPSSLMRAARHASRWSFGEGEPGLLLREHFRCDPAIIGFCNELLYDGLLEPKRKATSSRLHGLHPAFTWVDVPSSQDVRQGSSRVNRAEAQAIAQWIVENYPYFLDLYRHQEEDPDGRVAEDELIGVVTPFSAQARLIRQEIVRAAAEASGEVSLPRNLAGRITVGTAHRLQGAERPIILFSAVYGTTRERSGFIDATPELMNVAVSRAKDLLVVFAAPNRRDVGPVFGVMSRFARRPAPARGHRPDAAGELPAPAAPTPPVRGDASTPPTGGGAPPPSSRVGEPTTPCADTPSATPPEDESPQRSLTAVIRQWEEAGHLTEDDEGLTAASLNPRLAEVGLLAGEPGHWRPTPLAALLGVVEIERTGASGTPYTSIGYTAQAQQLLSALYRDGNL